MDTILPGVIAFGLGAFLAVAALVPWTAREYRRHGHLGGRRSLLAFVTLVYGLALVTYTLLPLPSDIATICQSASTPQLDPLAFVRDIARNGGISGPASLLTNPASAQVIFNVLLFLPLGAFVRNAFARSKVLLGLAIAAGFGFGVSLLIELTQLTGDWFLYPCSYRLFDVDDLMANTGGALLGSFLAPVVGVIFSPRRSAPDNADAARPVTAARRFLGMFADLVAIGLTAGGLGVAVTLVFELVSGDARASLPEATITLLAFVAPIGQLVIVLITGRTLGELVVRLRPVPAVGPGRRIVRWLVGSGGWATLSALGTPLASLLALALACASIIAVWATVDRRGLALAITGQAVEDDRTAAGLASAGGESATKREAR